MRINILIFLLISSSCISCASSPPELNNDAPTIFITGSNRGLGLEFTRQYAALGWNVVASCRHPASADELQLVADQYDSVIIEKLDVTKDSQVQSLAEKYQGLAIDVLLNNAGIYGSLDKQTLGNFDFEEAKRVIDVNALGPLRMSEAFMDNVLASKQKKIISLGGGMGTQSIGRLFGGHYFMKMSKSANLMAMGVMQKDLQDTGIQIVMISPGRVDTQLMRDSGWTGSSISAADSASAVIKMIGQLDEKDNGRLIMYNGRVIPW